MYRIDRPENFTLELNIDSFEIRFQKLFKEGKKIVYVKNQFDNSTFRYRYYNVEQAMSKQKEYVVTCFQSSEIPLILRHLQNIDILILQRAMWDLDMGNLVGAAKGLGIRIVYDIDDLIMNPKYVPIYLNNLGIINNTDNYFDVHFNFASKYYTLAVESDSFITTNTYLSNILKKDFEKGTYIIPNFLNEEQETHSVNICRERAKDSSKFLLGYFSGSPSHKEDFNLIAGDLKSLFEKYDDIYLKIVGYIDIPNELKGFEDRIIQVPFVSYEELQYEIGEVDVNLVPLQQNIFNNCKSELKYFEAGIVDVISCCSPTYIYQNIVEDGINGYICRDGEWFSKLEYIYKNQNKMVDIVKNAHKTSVEMYGVSNQEKAITTVYDSILSD